MAHYLSSNPKQMKATGDVLAEVRKCEGSIDVEQLARNTSQDLRSVLAAIEYLLENREITMFVTPKKPKISSTIQW
jgi:hypothetical protein